MLFKHYWAQGCFAQPEVDIHFQAGLEGSTKLITDVDVFVFRPHPDLYYERVLGDCRTLRGISPINRALWLRGLMACAGAASGCVLLSANTQIEQDHKLAASEFGIVLLNETDFKIYDKALVYPDGSQRVSLSIGAIHVLKNLPSKYPKLERLTTYIYRDAWRKRESYKLIRHCLAALLATSGEFDPAKREHLALICDASAIFAIGVGECAGRIFHQYLHPQDKQSLSDSLKILIWGGIDVYKYLQQMQRRLLQAKSGAEVNATTALELPEWNVFVQLIRSVLDNPAAGLQVPRLLRQMATELLHGDDVLVGMTANELMALKYSMLLVSYVCRAGRLPAEFERSLVGKLVAIQSDLAVSRTRRGHPSDVRSVEAPKQPEVLGTAPDTSD